MTQFLYEDGLGNVVDEDGRPEPMDYIVDQKQFTLETITSHTQYLQQAASERPSQTKQIEVDKPREEDSRMRESTEKRVYTRYTAQDKARFFKLKIEKCMSASAAAKQLEIHIRTAQRWAKQKGDPAVVTVPTTRVKTTTILGAISAAGLIKVSVRIPKPNKKGKADQKSEYISTGTVTGHYISFLKDTLDEMDNYPHMKGHYLVMDNAPIHRSKDIAKYIEVRGYRCASLPSYSPELNPIEQFWSVTKSKVKRHRFLQQEVLSTGIRDACNNVKPSDFHGFVSHSHKSWDKYRNKENM
ncbi:hypothetical protein VTP01DRAFT_7800 [Rhizomucor pusillus]|uniref:uncharacterized protein n=1 Tax=Rhizomucor pusillus TaxID=4840 RepID=UPI0037428B14